MNKFFYPLAALCLICFSSCDKLDDVPDTPNTQQLKGAKPTCVIPVDKSMPVTLTDSPVYIYTFDMITGQWNMGVSNLQVQGFSTLNFTSPAMYGSGVYNNNLHYDSPFESTTGEVITNLQGIISNDYYYYTGESSIHNNPLGTLTTMSFSVKDKYDVRAFPKQCYYGGSVVSTYKDTEGNDAHYTSASVQFGVNINLSSHTAEITIFNAKFAEAMPYLPRMVLSGLTVEGDHEHGYEIKGKNITPVVGEGQGAVPYPGFAFNEIEFHPADALMTKAECEFEVAGKYKGTFTGSFVK